MNRRAYGSGSIQKTATGKYIVQLSLGRDENGKRIRITRTATGQKEASRILKDLETKYANGTLQDDLRQQAQAVEPEGLTTKELFDRWYATKERNWAPRTRELYRHQLDAHAIPHLGDTPLEDLKPLHIQAMVDALADSGKVATANKVRSMVSSALKQAVRWELIGRNPAEAVDPIREERRALNVWTREQAMTFLRFHKNHRFYAAYYLLITSGLRRGELLGLRRQDITEQGVFIRQTVTVVRDKATVGKPKTKNSERFVALPEDALAVLREHLASLDETIELVGDAWERPELVFPSETGTLMHGRNFYRTWQHAVEAANLPHTRIHDLRHLHATLLIHHGEDPKVVSDRLGHASTSFTLDRYGHLYNERRQRAAHSLTTLLGEGADEPVADSDVEMQEEEVTGHDGVGAADLLDGVVQDLPGQHGRNMADGASSHHEPREAPGDQPPGNTA